jgi:hypothetical protein
MTLTITLLASLQHSQKRSMAPGSSNDGLVYDMHVPMQAIDGTDLGLQLGTLIICLMYVLLHVASVTSEAAVRMNTRATNTPWVKKAIDPNCAINGRYKSYVNFKVQNVFYKFCSKRTSSTKV